MAPSGELGSPTLLPDRTQCDQLPLQPSQLKLLSARRAFPPGVECTHTLQSQVCPSLNYCLCCNGQKVNAVMVNCLKKTNPPPSLMVARTNLHSALRNEHWKVRQPMAAFLFGETALTELSVLSRGLCPHFPQAFLMEVPECCSLNDIY